MTPQRRFAEEPEDGTRSGSSGAAQLSSHETWSLSAPIRLAGYEEEPEDAHILRGID